MEKYSSYRLIFSAALMIFALFPSAALSAPVNEPGYGPVPDLHQRLFVRGDLEKPGERSGGNASASSVFGEDSELTGMEGLESKQTITLSGTRISSPAFSVGESIVRKRGSFALLSGEKRKRMAVSMISSALLPGLGEFFLYLDTGSKSILARAIGFIALEGYLWYGYDYNHDKGKDFKRQYEAYGDKHWSEDRFLENHPYCDVNPGSCDTWEDYNANAKDSYAYFYYTPREMDTEEYYENMGKYDAFLYGWDDWNGEYEHLGGSPNYWTDHRTEFWGLRGRSNDYLLKADRHIMGMIASRIVSMIHAGWLASKSSVSDEGWSLEFKNGRLYSRIGVMYRF